MATPHEQADVECRKGIECLKSVVQGGSDDPILKALLSDADRHFNNAIETDRAYFLPFLCLGILSFFFRSDPESAKHRIERANALGHNSAEGAFYLALVYLGWVADKNTRPISAEQRAEMLCKAVEFFTIASRREPQFEEEFWAEIGIPMPFSRVNVYKYRGYAYTAQGAKVEAEEDFGQVRRLGGGIDHEKLTLFQGIANLP